MAGNLTPSALLAIKLKAEQMWADAQFATDYEVNAQAAVALLENQTARITPLEQSDKDHSVTVNWVKAAVADEAVETNCTLSEDELDTAGKSYALDIERKAGFSINEEKLRTNSYNLEELAARGQMSAIKALDEFWARQVLLKAKAFAGTNAYPTPHAWDAVNGTTNVTTANYTRKLYSYMVRVATQMKINAPYFIDNSSLFEDFLNAEIDAANGEGKGDGTRARALRMYTDFFNFGTAALAEDTFMINRSAMAMATQNRFSSTPRVVGGKIQQTVYTVRSRVLPGIEYDVYYTIDCVTNGVTGKAEWVDVWRFQTRGGIFLNPEANDGFGGVLSFTKVA
jgi:hypothetical protein